LAGKSLKDMIVKESAALMVNLGDTPRDTYKSMKRMPSTRMGIMATLKEAFRKSQSPESDAKDSKMEAISRALKREIPTRIHANRLDDILAAIRFSEEFGIRLILDHCVEGYKIADSLAKKDIPVIVHNNFLAPKIFEETRGFEERYAGNLSKHGVRVGFQSDSVVGGKILKFARLNAMIYVSYGMSKEEALKGLTIYPAQIFGVADRIGSIEEGKDADLVILDGEPFDIYANIKAVLINGEVVFRQ
jgi:imidazolonepropionase-like amidohydrolase